MGSIIEQSRQLGLERGVRGVNICFRDVAGVDLGASFGGA